MKTLRKRLTATQKARGVVYSSTLSTHQNEQSGDTTHEIMKGDKDRANKERRLEDVSFFKNSHFKFNITRE